MSALIDSAGDGSAQVREQEPVKVRVTAQELAAQARDKTEIYHKVAHELDAYLPGVDQVTTWHMRDLASGVKKRIRGKDVKSMHVPSYEGLALKDFAKLIDEQPFVQMCLPDREKEMLKMGRTYLINVLYTRLGEKFKTWVDERVERRHQEVREEGKKYIELD